MESLNKLLALARTFSTQNIIAVLLLCLIGLGTFYVYKKIDNIEFIVEKEIQKSKDKYLREFGLDQLKDLLEIRDILAKTQQKNNIKSVTIWGYHNGVDIGPFPFRKISLIDESVKSGGAQLARDNQDLPLNLYVDLTVAVWKRKNSPTILTLEDAKKSYPNIFYDMQSNGVHYQFLFPLSLKDYEPPIGLFVTYLDEGDTKRLIHSDPEMRKLFEAYLTTQAKRVELIFNRQFIKLQLQDGK